MKILFIFSILFTLSFSQFIKSENIVIDKVQNLMWQDNIETTYCEELVLNGYIDWKLPSIKQLQSLIDQESKTNYLDKTFEFFKEGDYFSSTPNINDISKYWYINFKTGIISFKDKETLGFIRCVRETK